MNASGPSQLGDTGDGRFDVLGRDHHEVRHLVDDADDVGQLLVLDAHAVIDHFFRRGDRGG